MKTKFIISMLILICITVFALAFISCEKGTDNDEKLNMEHVLLSLKDGFYRMGLPETYTPEYANSIALYSYVNMTDNEDIYFDCVVSKDPAGEYNDFYKSIFGENSSFPNITVKHGPHEIITTENEYIVSPGAFSGGYNVQIVEVNANSAIVVAYWLDVTVVNSNGKEYSSIDEMLEDYSNLEKWEIEFESTNADGRVVIKNIKRVSA